jgi:hypothetical protein
MDKHAEAEPPSLTVSLQAAGCSSAAAAQKRNCQIEQRTPMIPWPCQSSLVRGVIALHCMPCCTCAESWSRTWPLYLIFISWLCCASPLSFQTRILQINIAKIPCQCQLPVQCSVCVLLTHGPSNHTAIPCCWCTQRQRKLYPLFRLSVETSDFRPLTYSCI